MRATPSRSIPLRTLAILAVGAAVLLVPSCTILRPTADPSRRFVLRSLAAESDAAAAVGGSADLVLGVGPVVLPDYLERSQIVVSASVNEILVEEFFLWGENLDRGIAQVLAASIAHYAGSSRVAPFPEVDLGAGAPRVSVIVRRFEPTTDGAVILEARWAIVAPGAALGESEGRRFATRVPVVVDGAAGDLSAADRMEARVTAMSMALDELAREIVRSL